MFVSEDSCELSGVYWSSNCGHPVYLQIEEGAKFPACEICGRHLTFALVMNEFQDEMPPLESASIRI